MRGGRIDFRIFERKHWRPAQIKAGIEPLRGLYDLRHTYATFAPRAGIPVFAVSRFMGSSIAARAITRDTHSPANRPVPFAVRCV
jgi:integrase